MSENLRNSGDGVPETSMFLASRRRRPWNPFPSKGFRSIPAFYSSSQTCILCQLRLPWEQTGAFSRREYFRRIRIGASIQDIVLYAFPGFRQGGEVEHAPVLLCITWISPDPVDIRQFQPTAISTARSPVVAPSIMIPYHAFPWKWMYLPGL